MKLNHHDRSSKPETVVKDTSVLREYPERGHLARDLGRVVGGGLVLLLAANGVASVKSGFEQRDHALVVAKEQSQHAVEVAKARDVIAQRYGAGCTLESATDLHKLPKTDKAGRTLNFEKNAARTTVSLKVVLKVGEEANRALAKYTNDDTVMWGPPSIGARLNLKSGGRPVPVAGSEDWMGQNVGYKNLNPTADLYPRTNYPDGTTMPVYVRGDAVAHGPTATEISIGLQPCGTIVFRNGSWERGNNPTQMQPELTHEIDPIKPQ